MLVKFYAVDFVANPFVDTLSPRLSDDIPQCICAFFSESITRFVFCVDASIDLTAICAELGLPCEFIHDLEVLDEEYNKGYLIGLKEANIWCLIKMQPPSENQ